MLTLAVLGPVEVRRDGELVRLPSGKTSELLVRLCLDVGSRLRADALLEDLWVDGAGRNTLQSKVSQLRRALGEGDLLVGTGDGYLLAVDPGCIDAAVVLDLAVQAAAARRSGDQVAALEKGRAGLELFRGEVLVECGDWATPHRARFEEVRLGLVEDVMAAQVALGAGAELVGELETLVEQNPLREGLWASLVTALYRAGRQADALAAYARVRRLLVDELGVEPGAELRALEQRVLQQDPVLHAEPAPVAGTPGNLPSLESPLVGRHDDLAALTELLAEHRLVTLVGPAGVGKTRLSIAVGSQLAAAGGVWLVRLDAVEASADLVQLVGQTLHVGEGEQALVDRLAGADTVLLLDNCEHLVAEAAGLVQRLLEAVPRLRVLATSQLPLGIEGELVHALGPLTDGESVALFAERARRMRRGFVLDDETAPQVAEVCRSLDGLPLAIELAAARVRSLSVRDIAQRLGDRFALLRDPTSNRPERRRALAGALAWSYDLLFPDDQRGLWALSCFAGSASLDAAEHVVIALGVPRAAVLDTITRLVDRSLVSVDEVGRGEVRYRLLDSIRAYAADRLAEAGQADVAAAAHAEWYAGTAAWLDAHVRGTDQPQCLAIAMAERANVDAALAWCAVHDPDLGMRIGNGFGWTWVVLGDGTAGAARVRDAISPTASPRDRATGLLVAGWLEASAGDVVLAQTDLDGARAIADELDDVVLLADAQRHQAFVSIQQGRPEQVLADAAASLATYRPRAEPWPIAGGLLMEAFGSLMVGDLATATRDASEAVEILTPVGDSWGLVHAQAMLGGIAQAEHRLDDAARALTRAAEESRTMGFLGQAALHRATLARVQQRAGDAGAAASFEEAIADARAVGDGRLAATARLNLARLLRAEGDPVAATALLQENQRWYAAAGGGDGALLTRCVLAATTSDHDVLEDVLHQATDTDNAEVQLYALDALARIAAEQERWHEARQGLDEADALAPGVAHLVDDADRLDAMRAGGLLSVGVGEDVRWLRQRARR